MVLEQRFEGIFKNRGPSYGRTYFQVRVYVTCTLSIPIPIPIPTDHSTNPKPNY